MKNFSLLLIALLFSQDFIHRSAAASEKAAEVRRLSLAEFRDRMKAG